jgi:hypothetical protein
METVAEYTKRDDGQGVSWFTCLTARLDSVQMSDYKEKSYIAIVQLSGLHSPMVLSL